MVGVDFGVIQAGSDPGLDPGGVFGTGTARTRGFVEERNGAGVTEGSGGADGGTSDPAVTLAASGSGSPSMEPGVALAAIEGDLRRYRGTVSRSTPSSRAMRRLDQPPSASDQIDCWRLY